MSIDCTYAKKLHFWSPCVAFIHIDDNITMSLRHVLDYNVDFWLVFICLFRLVYSALSLVLILVMTNESD